VNWHLHGVHAGETDLAFILFSNDTWFHLTEYFNSWHNSYWPAKNSTLIRDMPWHDLLVDVLGVLRTTQTTGNIFVRDHKFSLVRYVY